MKYETYLQRFPDANLENVLEIRVTALDSSVFHEFACLSVPVNLIPLSFSPDSREDSLHSLNVACAQFNAWLFKFHFHCGIQFLGITSIVSSMLSSFVVAM